MFSAHVGLFSLQMDDFKRSRYHSFSGSGKDQKMTVNLAGVGKPTDLVEEAEFLSIFDIQEFQSPIFCLKKSTTRITEQHPQFSIHLL